MSRAAQEIARFVREQKKQRRRPVNGNGNDGNHNDDETTAAAAGDSAENVGDLADVTSSTEEAASEGEADVTKKKAAKKAKAPKKAKAAKTPKAPKAAKTPKAPKAPKEAKRSRVAASGEITAVQAKGETYIEVTFTEGTVTLTPTSNRVHNRDLVVAALKTLLK